MALGRPMSKSAPCPVGFARILGVFLKRDVTAASFWLSLGLVFLALFYSKDIAAPGPGMSAVAQFIFPISWNNALGLVALAAGLCSAVRFAQERATAYVRYLLARISRRRYLAARFTSVCLSTGAAVCGGCLLFALYSVLVAGDVLVPSDSSQVKSQFMSALLAGGMPVLWFAVILFIQFLFGTVLGALGVCATAFAANRFIAYSAPFILLFVWNQACSWAGLPAWASPLGLAKCAFSVGAAPSTFAVYLASFLAAALLSFAVFYLRASKEARFNG